MDRRTFLAVSSAAGLVGVGGCLAQSDDDGTEGNEGTEEDVPELPEGMEVATHHTLSHNFEEDPDGHHDRSRDERHVVVEDQETAADWADSVAESATSFIEDSAFDESHLLILQNSMQSAPELALVAIEREGDGLAVELLVDRPEGDNSDDQVSHTLFVRITDDTAGVPNSVSLAIDYNR